MKSRGQRALTALHIMAKKTTLTATLPNGEIIKRTTARTYTHVVIVMLTYDDGQTGLVAEWAGRPDLALKNLAKMQKNWAGSVGEVSSCGWNRETSSYDRKHTCTDVKVLMIPVNA